MPFASKAQQRFMFATDPKMAREFADATPDIKSLPEKITSSDPAQTRKRHKQKKKASARDLVSIILGEQGMHPVEYSAHDLLQIAIHDYRQKCSQSSHSTEGSEKCASQASESQENAQSVDSRGTSQSSESILGGTVHTADSARNAREMMKRAGSTALRAKHVADSIFRQTVASIHEAVANCDSGTPHEKQAVVAPRGSLTTPLAEAQQQMQAFLPGQPLQAGQGVPQTGLDGPMAQDAQTADAGVGRATAVPGMEGTAAANPIDMHGGLDPRGLALDGNHAAGVQKGFKIASLGDWLLGSDHGAPGEKEAKDQVPGGKADNKPDSAFPADEIQQGQKVEMEHTDSPAMAKEIAKDHLTESTEYYDELAKMEDKMAQSSLGRMLASLGYERTESGGVQDKYASQGSHSV